MPTDGGPDGGVSPDELPIPGDGGNGGGGAGDRDGGVSPAELPVTGAPIGLLAALGGALLAAGAAARFAVRRRRS